MQRSAKFSRELSQICDFIETTPVFMINDLVDAFQISYNTASNRVDMLVEMNIVKKDNEQHRNRIFAAQKYIDIYGFQIDSKDKYGFLKASFMREE